MHPKFLQEAARSKLGLWTAVILAVWAAGFFILNGFFMKKIQAADLESRSLEQQIRQTREFLTVTPDLDKAVDEAQKTAEAWAQKTLKAGEHAKVVSAVAEATKANGIVISSLKPVFSEKKEKVRRENRRIIPSTFELKMQCRYQQLGEFFESLENMPLLLSINSYEISAIPLKPGMVDADITLTAYEESLA